MTEKWMYKGNIFIEGADKFYWIYNRKIKKTKKTKYLIYILILIQKLKESQGSRDRLACFE